MINQELETRLIGKAAAGDIAALEELLQSQYSRVLQYVDKHLPPELRRCIDPTDVVQDVFFEACRLIGSFKPAGEDCLFRWLATIARHSMIDLLRSFRAQRRGGDRLQLESDSAVASMLDDLAVYRRTPSKSAASHEFIAALEVALGRLPPDFRRVVVLRHIDGLSVQETARQMSRTEEGIYVLCSRALKAIREDLRSASHFL